MKRFPVFLPMRFCPHRCVYCDQGAITGEESRITPADVHSMLQKFTERLEICYFGGSFTCFPLSLQADYLDAVRDIPGSIVRFSTNPLCLGDDVMEQLHRYPISMVELGITSLDDDVLKTCNRGYSSEFALSALDRVQREGFDLCAQMMIGLPGQSLRSSLEDLRKLAKLKGSREMTLRIYPCLVLKNTPLLKLYERGEYMPLDNENCPEWAGRMLFHAKELGFRVQRVGLHETPSLADSVVAGPHHPASGEFAGSVALALKLHSEAPEGPWEVPQKDISKLTGHGHYGLRYLANLTGMKENEIRSRLTFL